MTTDNTTVGPITSSAIRDLLITKTGADPEIFDGTAHLSLAELGIDSLAVLELTAVMDGVYGLKVPSNALELTLDDIAAEVGQQESGF
jgi:acyl carrier protein